MGSGIIALLAGIVCTVRQADMQIQQEEALHQGSASVTAADHSTAPVMAGCGQGLCKPLSPLLPSPEAAGHLLPTMAAGLHAAVPCAAGVGHIAAAAAVATTRAAAQSLPRWRQSCRGQKVQRAADSPARHADEPNDAALVQRPGSRFAAGRTLAGRCAVRTGTPVLPSLSAGVGPQLTKAPCEAPKAAPGRRHVRAAEHG